MTTMYRVSKSVRMSDTGPAERGVAHDHAAGSSHACVGGSVWSTRRDRRASSSSPVVAMIEPFHREFTPDDDTVHSKIHGKQLHAMPDEQKRDIFPNERTESNYHMQNYKPVEHSTSLFNESLVNRGDKSSHPLHLETSATEVSSEQTSPGSVCSTDSGIGSTQSITELCTQENKHSSPGSADFTYPSVGCCVAGTQHTEKRVHYSDVVDQYETQKSSAVQLKRFIKRNLRTNSDDSGDDSDADKDMAMRSSDRDVHTPEPQPQYRVDVTTQDQIWQKSSDLSPSMVTWSPRDPDLPSDTESESSQDTIILMTSSEHIEGDARQIQFIGSKSDAAPQSGINENWSIDIGEIPGDVLKPSGDHGKFVTYDYEHPVLIHHHKSLHDQLENIAKTEQNLQQKVSKRVTFSERLSTDNATENDYFHKDTHMTDTAEKSEGILKTNYGYLSRNRIPSFRKMNQTFRRPTSKTTRGQPSDLEKQLRALSIEESEEENAPAQKEPVLSQKLPKASILKPVSSQPKKRVHFNDVVMKRIVCPPDNDLMTFENEGDPNLDVYTTARQTNNHGRDPNIENVLLNNAGVYNVGVGRVVSTSVDPVNNSQHSSYTSYGAPYDTSRPGDAGIRTDDSKSRVKYRLSRTPSIDRKHAQTTRPVLNQGKPPSLQQKGQSSQDNSYANVGKELSSSSEDIYLGKTTEPHMSMQYKSPNVMSGIPFFKDNMILYSTGKQEYDSIVGDSSVLIKSTSAVNESICDELTSFVNRDRDRIDKLRQRYRPTDGSVPQVPKTHENTYSENASGIELRTTIDDSSEVVVRRGQGAQKIRPNSDIVLTSKSNDRENSRNRVRPLPDESRRAVRDFGQLSITENSSDHSKAVFGTTADLFKMMHAERRRGSQAAVSGSKLVRRHSSHVHGTRDRPVTMARSEGLDVPTHSFKDRKW